MLKRYFLILLLLVIGGFTLAQDELDEQYVFVDGTTVNFPGDFLTIYEDYDEMYLANADIELRFYITYERTILSRELESLPEVLDWWWDNPDVYEIGDEEPIFIGDREGIQFEYERTDGVDALNILLPIIENGSVAVVTIIPSDATDDDARIMSIIESLHAEDFGSALETILGNSFVFDDGWLIEYTSDWTVDEETNSLSREEVTLTPTIYTTAEVEALELKDDPIELLYYDLFAPVDESIVFDPENISFVTIGGRDGIRYAVLDSIDEENVQRVYFLATLDEDDVLAIEATAPVGANILQNEDVEAMIQTIRPEGSLPPIEMMSFDNAFNLPGVGEIRFPAYWRARENDNDTITLSTVDVHLFIIPYDSAFVEENGYNEDLTLALLNIVSPLDESVILNPDDVESGSLQNGNSFAQTTYIETDEGRSYPRTVMTILLDNNAMVFVGYSPQPGVEALSDTNENEVQVILNTIVP